MNQSTPNLPPVIFDKVCIVYHHSTGNIFHMHRIITYEGGYTPTTEEIHARAMEHANALHKDLNNEHLKITLADPHHFNARRTSFKIDVKSQQLVGTPHDTAKV